MSIPSNEARSAHPQWSVRIALWLTLRAAAALGIVAAITFVFSRLITVNATTTGFFYLVAILMIATTWGLVESTIASVAAMLCFNYFFLPPVGTFTVADPQNWVALFAFLATSLTASQLSARAKRRTKEAVQRQREMETLYSLSRAFLLADESQPVAKQIVQQIAYAFEFPAVALYDRGSGATYRAGAGDLPDIEAKLREAVVLSTPLEDDARNVTFRPIRLGGQPIASLAIQGADLSDAALQSLLNIVAIGLERTVAQQMMNRAEVARRSEELKSTLLDAIAHEFKTPLTSVKAATTDLLSAPAHDLQPHQRELISIADEGADRLSRLVTEAIQLARIEGGKFRLNQKVHFPKSLISAALRQTKSLNDEREISVSAADDLPLVYADAELIQMVIAHLIENALKYSPAGSPIAIGACAGEDSVIISVVDRGPGIAEEEQPRIFEKFYRSGKDQNLKSTGMGLAIAREIVRAHRQEIGVRSTPGQGSEFSFSLPLAPRSPNE